jgi:hypothetical protein
VWVEEKLINRFGGEPEVNRQLGRLKRRWGNNKNGPQNKRGGGL